MARVTFFQRHPDDGLLIDALDGQRAKRNDGANGALHDGGRPAAAPLPLELRTATDTIRLHPGAIQIIRADARKLPLPNDSVDLVVTSPPYWHKRDYGLANQIGQEPTPTEYVSAILTALRDWCRVLRPTGSVFLNIGDTYWNRSLAAIPGRIEAAARDDGWIVRNRIIWAKDGGMPEPAKDRLANRHEYILHLTVRFDYYYDLLGYADRYGNGANPGDVWHFSPGRHMGDHLAPFPSEIVERAIILACPREVCSACGQPRRRIVHRTANLDPSRPQARRAMELARETGLTPEHIQAIQATGVSDAGKALKVQNGTGRNSARVKQLASEAKQALGGYFREFTFAKRETVGWTTCGCGHPYVPGVVLDPFMGTGTTLRTALALGRTAIGADLAPPDNF
ncbi:MAG TPA: DNA methyltransferase [Chloroflexota bacterium]|jgi:DNA modification methylase